MFFSCQSPAKLAYPLTKFSGDFADAPRSKQQHDDEKDNDQLGWPDIEHSVISSYKLCRMILPIGGRVLKPALNQA